MIRWKLALIAAVLLVASTPPAWFPGAEFLVVAGLAGFYAFATSSPRPYLLGYGFGVVHMAGFAWSLWGVAGYALVAIVLLGAVYYLLIVAWLRAGRRWVPPAVAFAFGVAATAWLRAHMPEIPFPHGQVSHALFGWTALLGPVAWGGEVLLNLLVAALAAAAVDFYRSWRVSEPPWRRARLQLGVVAGVWVVMSIVSPPRPTAEPDTLDVLLLEPGRHDAFLVNRGAIPIAIRDRLLGPTLEAAGPRAKNPPDLVVWPEGALPNQWLHGAAPIRLRRGTVLVGGSIFSEKDHDYSICVALNHRGRVLGWHEKQVPVPAAERMPWLSLLPDFVTEWATGIVGYYPRCAYGRWYDPLEVGNVKFGGLVCYDNAFDTVARRHVDAGARALVVVSNETWFLQGGELDQMIAMSVFRALETGTPLVRSTVDGRTVAVTRDGSVLGPPPDSPSEKVPTKVLRAELELGPGALGPLAWLHPALVWLVLLSGLALTGLIRRK